MFADKFKKRTYRALGFIAVVVTLGATMFAYSEIRSRRRLIRNTLFRGVLYTKETQLQDLAEAHNNHIMEIDIDNLDLFDSLGEGEFGTVRRGILKTTNTAVAVKMLKG